MEMAAQASRSYGRGPTACDVCRNRKTKCDNQRPTCSYCTRLGVTCTYPDEDSAFVHTSNIPHLLQAIQHLTSLLERQAANRDTSPRAVVSPTVPFSPNPFNFTPQIDGRTHYYHHHYYDRERSGLDSPGRAKNHDRQAPSPVGLNAVLKWKSFSQPCPYPIIITDEDKHYPSAGSLPSTEVTELLRLEAKYIANVHTKNPTLDLPTLHLLILQVAEYGFDWSTRTCMVALVCALGAYSESYVLGQNAQSHTPVRSSNEHEAAVAYQYWNVAVKRLGLAIGQNSLEAVQCLCLTGIWYMNNMQPLQGWKHFALASNAWYTATIPRVASTTGGNEMSGDELLAIEQRLYFTCFKSEGELAFELSLPRSILESFEYQHTFPSPPPLDQQPGVGEGHEPERCGWYYYLAEIACRHVTNRITDVQRNRMPDPTTQGIEAMFEELEMFETQLNHWYDSLPTSVKFPLPVSDIRPLDDELSQLLRARYLGIREMCYRPFVHLAVNYHLDLQPDLLTKVAAIVSQGLKYCLFRIQAVPPQWRHHGLWFQLPNSTTCALVLIAADRARHDPALNTFRQVQLPSGWYLQILATRDLLARYWDNRRGGIWDCFRILDWALDS